MTVFAKSHHCHSFDHPDKIVVLLLVVRRKRVMTGSGGKIELASESLAQKGAFFHRKYSSGHWCYTAKSGQEWCEWSERSSQIGLARHQTVSMDP